MNKGPADYVQDIIPKVLDSKYPLVVVNEENHIQGIILRVHVLASLIGENGDNGTDPDRQNEGEEIEKTAE